MFLDRLSAGKELARELRSRVVDDPVVLALPRGGVPVGSAIAAELHAPLDILIVRKLASPHRPEFALGAVGEFGICIVDEELQSRLGIDEHELAMITNENRLEIERRSEEYRAGESMMSVAGRHVIIADDGAATGSTAFVAVKTIRALAPKSITIALPTASAQAVRRLKEIADDVVCLEVPEDFGSVGSRYVHFDQVDDDEVRSWLRESAIDGRRGEPFIRSDADIPLPGGVHLSGQLRVPHNARALVIFAHGSGSSRYSVRNQYVARRLERAGFATLLFDLLTEGEAASPAFVFNVDLLGERLRVAKRWASSRHETRGLPVCYFGASTGAAAALNASVGDSDVVAIVSRGGRPDLAVGSLPNVTAPTLLIVGEHDVDVMDLNIDAKRQMSGEVVLDRIPDATHLFAEAGALEVVTRDAIAWFSTHVPQRVTVGSNA